MKGFRAFLKTGDYQSLTLLSAPPGEGKADDAHQEEGQ